MMLVLVKYSFLFSSFFNGNLISGNHTPVRYVVEMTEARFVPENLEVQPGDTVEWINDSRSVHNVIANDKSFKSSLIKRGESHREIFRVTGRFPYFCRPHRAMGMKGTITVK